MGNYRKSRGRDPDPAVDPASDAHRPPGEGRSGPAGRRARHPGGGRTAPEPAGCRLAVGLQPAFVTGSGTLYEADCVDVLGRIPPGCVDTVFADPPFNLAKDYGPAVNDRRAEGDYLDWCRRWLDECCRVLRPGGAIFVYNIPRWNIELGHHLGAAGMQFRHWIPVSQKSRLLIPGRLYPEHYSLLYYSKGKPKTFRRIRTPIETCRHCGGELKDYGGHRDKMNAAGVNLTDIWSDICPVRHGKFKSPKWKANAVSTKILDRVVEMTTREGDLVLDPFGGSGTTFAVCERKGRRWVGIEIEPEAIAAIVERLSGTDLGFHENNDYVEDT
jgi:site-specific DNA-methyltransferase (adenine-specific)